MNWYKKILIANKMFNFKEFIDLLSPFGVIIERYRKKGGVILLNLNNNQRSPLHSSHPGDDVTSGMVGSVLRKLKINRKDFEKRVQGGKEKYLPIINTDLPSEKKENEEWKDNPWYKDQLQYANNPNNIKSARGPRYPGQLQGDESRPSSSALGDIL